MKSLQEIKDEYTKELGYASEKEYITKITKSNVFNALSVHNRFMNEVAKRYALEACREALKNAAENAKVREIFYGDESERFVEGDSFADSEIDLLEYVVSKESILSETNIPDLL